MKRRALSALVGLVLATLGHFVIARLFGPLLPVVDLLLVATLLLGIRGGQVEGMLAGMVAGTVADAITGGPFGLHGFTLTAAGYGVGLAADRVAEMTEFAAGVLAAAGAMVATLLRVGLLYLFVSTEPRFEWWWLPTIVGTSLLLVWCVRLAMILSGRLGGWQRGRQNGTLRL